MKNPIISTDLSKIKSSKLSLNKGNKDLNIQCYGCSKRMSSVNLILQGEWCNFEIAKRNSFVTAIHMETGNLVGENLKFILICRSHSNKE